MKKKPVEPLIPLEQLKKVVAGLIRVPKDTIKPKGRNTTDRR